MSNLNTTREEIAGKLNAAGVNASVDPQVQLPAVLVGAPSVVGTEGVGGWAVEFPVQVMGTPPGDLPSLEWMLDQVELVLITYFGAPAVPRTVTHLGQEVPSYVITLLLSVSNPNC